MISLQAFRIKNFRSIVDTGFHNLSPDGISLIVGQNESGKSSILDGIRAFETGEIIEDDLRSNCPTPQITCIFKFGNYEEFVSCVSEGKTLPDGIKSVFHELDHCIALTRSWETNDFTDGNLIFENDKLTKLWKEVENDSSSENVESSKESSESMEVDFSDPCVSMDDFVRDVYDSLPLIDVFVDNSLLPARIDLNDLINKNEDVEGYEGASNFLKIAEIDPASLQNQSNTRIVEDMLQEKNKRVNKELQKHWRQTVGKNAKIEVLLELRHHHHSESGKEGHPYLMFWIRDNNGRLSPVQRSKGVKWFISFYLKLEATAKNNKKRIFLIDEPGANLHASAQKDILAVFEKQKKTMQIIFTTHSPYLLDIEKVYRVLAVERADTEEDKSETKIISFQNLGSANIDTLLPLYTNMGVDISHQTVISKDRNILLEEISALFYFKGFWKLFGRTEKINFLPATGCTNVPTLANLMLGWGLSFSIVLDDDSHGRKVFKELKESKVCKEDKLIKIRDCQGIEDLFSSEDFFNVILKDIETKTSKSNSEFMKTGNKSKVIVARDFMLGVDTGEIKVSDLSKETKDRIKRLLSEIETTL